MLDAWFGNGGGLFAAYQLANTYGIYGSWGALEYLVSRLMRLTSTEH